MATAQALPAFSLMNDAVGTHGTATSSTGPMLQGFSDNGAMRLSSMAPTLGPATGAGTSTSVGAGVGEAAIGLGDASLLFDGAMGDGGFDSLDDAAGLFSLDPAIDLPGDEDDDEYTNSSSHDVEHTYHTLPTNNNNNNNNNNTIAAPALGPQAFRGKQLGLSSAFAS